MSEFLGGRGSSSKESFAGGLRVLAHGNQLLGRVVSSYDPEVQFRQSAHTLDNIWATLDSTFTKPEAETSPRRNANSQNTWYWMR